MACLCEERGGPVSQGGRPSAGPRCPRQQPGAGAWAWPGLRPRLRGTRRGGRSLRGLGNRKAVECFYRTDVTVGYQPRSHPTSSNQITLEQKQVFFVLNVRCDLRKWRWQINSKPHFRLLPGRGHTAAHARPSAAQLFLRGIRRSAQRRLAGGGSRLRAGGSGRGSAVQRRQNGW